MLNSKDSITILMADDDEEDCMMTKEAMEEGLVINKINFVHDGEELMDYLLRKNKYENLKNEPLPGLILLDLNMPKKDGREALKEIKSHMVLKRIPIVVLTTSKAEEDILRTYDLGVNSYITKPVTFTSLVDCMKILAKYWLKIVELPSV